MDAHFSKMALAKPRQWIKTVAAAGTPESLGRRSITALSRSGTLATATSTAHGLKVGDRVDVSGANPADYNVADARVETVPTADTFTYRLLEPLSAAIANVASGTIVATCHVQFRRATVLGNNAARTPNTGSVWFGPESTNDSQPFEVLSGGESKIGEQAGVKYDLADWYLDVATAADGVVLILT
jgi:hypothetical protein